MPKSNVESSEPDFSSMSQAFESVEKLVEDFRALDRQIDQAVYQLYGLTMEEIKVVENV